MHGGHFQARQPSPAVARAARGAFLRALRADHVAGAVAEAGRASRRSNAATERPSRWPRRSHSATSRAAMPSWAQPLRADQRHVRFQLTPKRLDVGDVAARHQFGQAFDHDRQRTQIAAVEGVRIADAHRAVGIAQPHRRHEPSLPAASAA